MIELVLEEMKELANEFKREASSRRAITPTDPTADVFGFCARRLEEKADEVGDRSAWLTPEQYGRQFVKPVTGMTVRNWIMRGELDAEQTPHGYMIHRNAKRRRHA